MESRDGAAETAGAGWIDVQGIKKGEVTVETTSCEREVIFSAVSSPCWLHHPAAQASGVLVVNDFS
jgi:hypothetical protein